MNKEIELLNKKIEAQDRIINEQALEIARLKEQLTMLVQDDERHQEIIIKLGNKIDKAIEYIESHWIEYEEAKYIKMNWDELEIPIEEIKELLEILGDKE